MIFQIISLLVLLFPEDAYAFLPPEFFVQGLSALWIVLATGVAVALAPILIFFNKIKKYVKNNKKIIIFLVGQAIIIAIILGLFFYFKYYKPLYEDSYLFSQAGEQSIEDEAEEIIFNDLNPTIFNSNYIILDGLLRDEDDIALEINNTQITAEELVNEIHNGIKIYYIDIREGEEYEAGHIVGAINIRGGDLMGNARNLLDVAENLKDELSLTEKDFNNSLIILYCHDGSRGGVLSSYINLENVKSINGGVEAILDVEGIDYTGGYLSDKSIFGMEYQREFQTLANDAVKIIKENNAFVVDIRNEGRYNNQHVKGSLYLKYNTMSTEEYEYRLDVLLKHQDEKILFIAERYSELFYTNLLMLRLQRDYDWDDNNFYILFSQFEELIQNPLIETEEGYSSPNI